MSPEVEAGHPPEVPETDWEETTDSSKRSIQVLIFTAALLLGPLLILGDLAVGRINNFREAWNSDVLGVKTFNPASIFDYYKAYFSLPGLQSMVPLDLLLVLHCVSILLAVIVIKDLIEAQVAKDPERIQSLILKAEKYLELILSLLVFFIILEYVTSTEFLAILASGNFWIQIGISAILAFALGRIIRPAVRSVKKLL